MFFENVMKKLLTLFASTVTNMVASQTPCDNPYHDLSLEEMKKMCELQEEQIEELKKIIASNKDSRENPAKEE